MENFYTGDTDSGLPEDMPVPRMRPWKRVLLILLVIAVIVSAAAGAWVSWGGEEWGEYIDVITVSGTITSQAPSSLFDTVSYDHAFLLDSIDALMEDDSNRALLLAVDSPGGGVYETDELYLKLMEYREVTGRPIYAYFGSSAASGGYYISMAAEKIYANRNTVTGSIGVITGTYMNVSGLMEKLGISTTDIVSGRNKAMGSSYQEMTDEQRAILQAYVDEAFEQFVGIVAEGRPKLSEERIRELADGRIYTARQAAENGLIDGIGSFEDTLGALEADYGLADCGVRMVEKDALPPWRALLGELYMLRPQNEVESMMELCREASVRTGYYCPLFS